MVALLYDIEVDSGMTKRTYGQYCGLAHALDLIGERWTLLMIREFLTGPKRFTELLDHLPGMGTNLLSTRLKMLVDQGIIDKTASGEYALTSYGQELEGIAIQLARWGLQTIGLPDDTVTYAGSWSVLAMHSVFQADKAVGVCEAYEYRIDNDVFHAVIDDGTLETREGPADAPAFTLHADTRAYRDIVAGTLTLREAVDEGRARIEGSVDALLRSGAIFDLSLIRPSTKRQG